MTVAVLGAGAGGLSAAVELTTSGHDVTLWSRRPATLERNAPGGVVRHRGVLGAGEVTLARVTSDLSEAISGVEAAVVCLPSVVHGPLFDDLAALSCSVPVVLNPGHTGGALHLRHAFLRAHATLPPVVELSTLTYVARVAADGHVDVTGRAGRVRAAALPHGEEALDCAVRLLPCASPVPDVLASSLSNVNLVLHPPGAVLAAAWVEATGGDFTFYVEGMTPGIGRVMQALDEERRAVAAAYGHDLPRLVDEMAAIGTVDAGLAGSGDLVAAIRGGSANAAIRAPESFEHRYYREDLAYGLVPFLALARLAHVATPVAEALLLVGATAVGDDVLTGGLNADRLGLTGLDLPDLLAVVRP